MSNGIALHAGVVRNFKMFLVYPLCFSGSLWFSFLKAAPTTEAQSTQTSFQNSP